MDKIAATIVKSAVLRTRASVARPSPSLFYLAGLNSKPIWKSNYQAFDFVENLKANHEIILKEFLEMRETSQSDYDTSHDEHLKLHQGEWSWNSYIQKGKRNGHFALKCPKTVDIIESITSLMTGVPFSYAFFSSLGVNSEISPHYGPSNLRLRVHFPLLVPDSSCGMRVGGELVEWKPGIPVIFDDAYEHHVWNKSESVRVLLLFDIWHPDLHPDEIQAIKDMFEYAQQMGWYS